MNQLEWKGEVRFLHPVILNGAEKEVGIVKSINKDVFHAIMQSVLRSRFPDEGGSCNLPAAAIAEEGHATMHSSNSSRGIRRTFHRDHASMPSSVSVGDTVIAVDPNYYRPTEVDLLIGDPSKAETKLDWQAETKLDELVKIMVESDFKKVVEKGY